MDLKNWHQYLCPAMEMLKHVTYPLPRAGKQILLAAEGETKAK